MEGLRSPSPVDLASPEGGEEPGKAKWDHEAAEQAEREAPKEAQVQYVGSCQSRATPGTETVNTKWKGSR